jgi:hypothetical protein
MAGEAGENGVVVREPVAATWSELHELRTQIRQDIKWNDLTSDVKNGALKHMEHGINDALHSVENAPELREASRLLRMADDFYRENMGPLNNQQIKSLVKALDSGLQADPKALLKIAVRDGKTEVANTIRNTVGPQTWDAMRAADVQEMMAQSRLLDGSVDGLKFAKQVEDRFQNGVLDVLHGERGGARLRQQAMYIQQLRGKLPVTALLYALGLTAAHDIEHVDLRRVVAIALRGKRDLRPIRTPIRPALRCLCLRELPRRRTAVERHQPQIRRRILRVVGRLHHGKDCPLPIRARHRRAHPFQQPKILVRDRPLSGLCDGRTPNRHE